MQHFMECEATF